MSKSKRKITTEHDESLSVANPFDGINLGNLPDAPNPKPDPTSADSKDTRSKGRVDVIREKSGRAGKTVTVLRAFPETVSVEELNAMALQLKKHCACGGSLKERTIELQGNVCEQVMPELEKLGFTPVRCGG